MQKDLLKNTLGSTPYHKPTLVIDENIAEIEAYFGAYFNVIKSAGRTITPALVKTHQADGLIIRSVTRVDAEMASLPLRFVGTATIGTDHVDTQALAKNNIVFASAAGCNAIAVAEYVMTVIATLRPTYVHNDVHSYVHTRPQLSTSPTCTLVIVGVGNVGRRLATLARRLGMRVIGVDPFITHWLDDDGHAIVHLPLQEALRQADVVSIHTPLTHDGEHPTYQLFEQTAFSALLPHVLLINSARGEVVHEQALLEFKQQHPQADIVLDVFPQEPFISSALLDACRIVTPHVAGYTLEGKIRGTDHVFRSCMRVFYPELIGFLDENAYPLTELLNEQVIVQVDSTITSVYTLQQDDDALRHAMHAARGAGDAYYATHFDALRKQYALRREWRYWQWPFALMD